MMTIDQRAAPISQVYASERRSINRDLQWLRATAALSVTVYHAANLMAHYLGVETYRQYIGSHFGVVAVAIFFAITGALMADILKTTDPHTFLIHRIVRLYPIYIITATVLPSILDGRLDIDANALMLVPNGMNATWRLGGVEWTLVFEVFFYVILYLVSQTRLRRHIEWFAVGWLAWIALVVVMGWAGSNMTQLVPFLTNMPFQTTATAFAAGLLIPALARRGVFVPARAPLATALVLIAGVLTLPNFVILAGAAAFLFVGMVVQNGSREPSGSIVSRSATKFGDWSFALYLCHAPLQIWMYTTLTFPPAVMMTLAVGVPLLLCIPLGMLDVRLYRRVRRWTDTATMTRRRVCATAFIVFYFVASAGFILDELV